MGLLASLRVKLIADIADYRADMQAAQTIAQNTDKRLAGVGAGLASMGGHLTNIATIAAGQLAAAGIQRLAGAVIGAGRDAITAVADYERLGASLTALTAKEIYNAGVITDRVAIGRTQVTLTAAQTAAAGALGIKIRDLNTDIQVGKERLDKAIASGKLSKAEIDNRRQAIEALQRQQAIATGELDKLAGKGSTWATVYQTVSKETLTMAEAQRLAGEKVKDLLNWTQKLAIESPFSQDDVAKAFKLALAYGFSSVEAKTLTGNLIDFAAATGATGDSMGRIALALGQMRARGKAAGGELMQLTEAGVGANEILASMGKTTKDVENGLVSADDFIAAFNKNTSRNFAGAAKAQAGTFSGLLSSLQDLKTVALRTIFTPLFTAFKPVLDGIVSALSSPAIGAAFTQIGEFLAKPISALRLFAVLVEQGITPIEALRTVISTTFGPDVLTTFDTVRAVVEKAFTWIIANKDVIIGALVGIGVVLAGGAIANAAIAIGAAIAAISLPVTLVIAAVALLAAAWVGDWGGIQSTLTAVWAQIQPVLALVWEWLQVNIPLAIQALSDFWTNTLLPAITAVWAWLEANLFPTLSSLANLVGTIVGKAVEALAGLWDNVLLPALTAVFKWISENIVPAFNAIKKVIETLNPALGAFINDPLKALQDGFKWLESLLATVKKLFDDFAAGIAKFELPDFLKRHSPSPLEQTFIGVRDSLKEIKAMGLPDFGSMAPAWGSYQPPEMAAAWGAPGKSGAGAGGRGAEVNVTIGTLGDGLDLLDAARVIGREVARRV